MLVNSRFQYEKYYLTYMVSDQNPHEEINNGDLDMLTLDQSYFFKLDFMLLFPILLKIKANLWVYRATQGTCFLLSVPLFAFEEKYLKSSIQEKIQVETILKEV